MPVTKEIIIKRPMIADYEQYQKILGSKGVAMTEQDKILVEVEKKIRDSDACHCILRYCEGRKDLPYGSSNKVIQDLASRIASWVLECMGKERTFHDSFEYGYNCHRTTSLKRLCGEKGE